MRSDAHDNDVDERFMRIALQQAECGQGRVEPNPMVGAVIVRDHHVLSSGHHQVFGGPHAEVEALRGLVSIRDAQGATIYVTLEPCCHQGKDSALHPGADRCRDRAGRRGDG